MPTKLTAEDLNPDQLRRLRQARERRNRAEAEAARRQDVWAALEYVPTPRQVVFHGATEFDVLYGGAAGGGKSRALTAEGIRACIRYPGIRVVGFRRTFPELEESLLAELAGFGYARALGGRWNEAKHDLTFPNGSVFSFRHARTMADATKRQGGQIQLLIIDELTLMPPDVVSFLQSRIRSGRADIPVLGIRSGSNPGGIGHGAVKAKYIHETTGTDHGAKVITDVRGRTVRFIPAKVTDNPHLNVEYAQDLDALPEEMRKAFRDGSWDAFAGQAFTEWNRDRHIVPATVAVSDEWMRYGGMDWGWSSGSTYLEAARDNDGRLWVVLELVMKRTTDPEQGRIILARSRARTRWADPSMFGQKDALLPAATAMAQVGLALERAENDRLIGKMRVHTYLADGDACPHHRALGWTTCPMIHVLDGKAPELVRTLPDLPTDPLHPEDVDTDAEDHAYDALRYMVMGVGTATRNVLPHPPAHPPVVDPADLLDTRPGDGLGVEPGGHSMRGPHGSGPRRFRPPTQRPPRG